VTVTEAAVVRVGEEKYTVNPAGAPLTDSITCELNPPCAFSFKVTVLDLPGATDVLKELEVSEKSEARWPLQWLTSMNASMEPSPVAKS